MNAAATIVKDHSVVHTVNNTDPHNKMKLSKLNKKAWKGDVNTQEGWIDCIRHSIKAAPSISWTENKSRKDCLHDINIADLCDLLYYILGVKQQINSSFQVWFTSPIYMIYI
jgi:hypothetical protein